MSYLVSLSHKGDKIWGERWEDILKPWRKKKRKRNMRKSQYDWWARQSCSPGWYQGAEFPHISSYIRINSEFLLLVQFSTICSECNLNQNSHHFFVIKFFLLQRIYNWTLVASFNQVSFSFYLFLFKSLLIRLKMIRKSWTSLPPLWHPTWVVLKERTAIRTHCWVWAHTLHQTGGGC